MKYISECRKILKSVVDDKIPLDTLKGAISEMLTMREMNIYDMIYVINDHKFDEKLRRRIQYVLHRNDEFCATRQSGRTRWYSLSSRSENTIEVNHRSINCVKSGITENVYKQTLSHIMNMKRKEVKAFHELSAADKTDVIADLVKTSVYTKEQVYGAARYVVRKYFKNATPFEEVKYLYSA